MWDWRYPPRGRALDELASLISHISNLVLVEDCRIPLTHTLHIIHGSRSRNIERELVPSCFVIFTFEPLTLSLTSMPSCDLESLTNILILCLILKASNQSLRKSLSLNLELS
ncbi:hypothetical protein Tco_0365653 [Tanacetum coccineum]